MQPPTTFVALLKLLHRLRDGLVGHHPRRTVRIDRMAQNPPLRGFVADFPAQPDQKPNIVDQCPHKIMLRKESADDKRIR